MKRKVLLCLGSILLIIRWLPAQNLIDVTEQTIKVKALEEEDMYFGFAEGDQLVFSFKELNGKDLKEVEIIEYPGTSKFADFKVSSINSKTIHVLNKSVYRFRFYNGAISGRICRIKIQRIPSSQSTASFNTNVKREVVQDTTWNVYTRNVIIGYDTLTRDVVRNELVSIDTLTELIFDKTIRVHSSTAINKTPYSTAFVELPDNKYVPGSQSVELVAWSYWIGVGQRAQEEYDAANKHLASGVVALGKLTGYGALASLAISGISLFTSSHLGDNVQYKFFGIMNGQEITIDYGNVTSASGRNDKVRQGSFSVELYNDNIREGIDVTLKVVVFRIRKIWQNVVHQEKQVTPRQEKQLFKDPVIQTRTILINEN